MHWHTLQYRMASNNKTKDAQVSGICVGSWCRMNDPIITKVQLLMLRTGQTRRAAEEAVAALHGYETYAELRQATPAGEKPKPAVRPTPAPQPRVKYRAPVRPIKPMSGPVHLSFRALVFFSSCPDIEMSTADMRVKFGLDDRISLNRYLDPLLKRGLVSRRVANHTSFYAAGPVLLAELGEEFDADEQEDAHQARWAGHERTPTDVYEDGMRGERPAWIPRGIE